MVGIPFEHHFSTLAHHVPEYPNRSITTIMHGGSSLPSALQPAECPQVFYPVAYDATQHGTSTHHQYPTSPRGSISTSASSSSASLASDSPSSLSSMKHRRGSCQNSTGGHETKRSYKSGFLNPASAAQVNFMVQRFKHRKQVAKEPEGLTAANLKSLQVN